MMLDRRASRQIAQALLQAKDRSSQVDGAAQSPAYANAGSPMTFGRPGVILPPYSSEVGEELWNWLTKPRPLSCPADNLPLTFPPLEKRGNFGGSNKRDCKEQWETARKMCEKELAKPNPNRRMTGGFSNTEDCANGLVSEECGGNPIKWRK